MNEKGPSAPDKEPPKEPLHLEGVPNALQIDMIEKLRTEEAILENKLVRDADVLQLDAQQKAREQARLQFDQLIEQHLSTNGIKKGDPNFAEYVALLRNYSVDHIPENVWKDGMRDDRGREEVPPMREVAYQEVRGKYYTPPATPEGKIDPGDGRLDLEPTTVPTLEEGDKGKDTEPKEGDKKPKTPEEIQDTVDKDVAIIAARENVKDLRTKLAERSAKRQARLWNRKNSKLSKEYAELEASYNDALIQLAKDELSAEKSAGLERNEDQERIEAALLLVTNFRDLEDKSVDNLKGTKVSKAIAWLTRGNVAIRIVKGATIGLVVGAGVALLTGTGGGAAIAAGTIASLATRVARGFATFDARAGRGMDVNVDKDKILEQAGAEGKSTEETLNLVHQHLMGLFEEATIAEQSKRRKSTVKALGAVAGGALAVELVHGLVDLATDYSPAEKLHGLVSSDHANAMDQAPQSPGTPPANPLVEQPKVPEKVYSPDAINIKAGEGFYQTFKEMNIPKQEWSGLLEKVGPDLHEMQVNGHPLAYKMAGQWGIRMTPDGHMPKAALDIISKAHDQMNGISTPAAISPEIPAPRVSLPIETPSAPLAPANIDSLTTTIDHGGIQNVIHKEIIQPSEIAGNPQLDKLTHVAPWMNPETIGQRLGLNASEWDRLQDYVATQVANDRAPLPYSSIFDVTTNGNLRFIGNDIPDNVFADMLSHIPVGVRARL